MTWLVAGLGNPGPEYASTRHNIGFMVADELARRARASFSPARGMHAQTAQAIISPAGLGIPPGEKLILAKPITFMNESGRAIGALAAFHKLNANQIIIIHDELDIDLGKLRLKLGGGDNGHNGLKSARAHLHTGDFYRVRFGIGRPPGRMNAADYVLRRFAGTETAEVAIQIGRAADACEKLMTSDLATTQSLFNS